MREKFVYVFRSQYRWNFIGNNLQKYNIIFKHPVALRYHLQFINCSIYNATVSYIDSHFTPQHSGRYVRKMLLK
jgi:hypothetical protein